MGGRREGGGEEYPLYCRLLQMQNLALADGTGLSMLALEFFMRLVGLDILGDKDKTIIHTAQTAGEHYVQGLALSRLVNYRRSLEEVYSELHGLAHIYSHPSLFTPSRSEGEAL